jgi:hypothetical protein
MWWRWPYARELDQIFQRSSVSCIMLK